MTTLPATLAEAEAIDTVTQWVDRVAAALTSEASRLVLRNHIRAMLRESTIQTMQVIAAARAGHQDADIALRELAIETLDRGEPLPTALGAYVQEALLRAPVTYPPGRNIADTWLRDVAIAVLVMLAVDRWHLPTTRNEATKSPSACSLVAVALHRRGFKIGEYQVGRIFRDHSKIARRLSASIPYL
jgi:hypothetical protein